MFCFVLFSCNNTQDKILPTERDLVESVYASVTIQPDSLYQVYAIVAGILDQNLVEEGTRVHKDQALIQIINNTPKLNSDNAKLTLQLAQQNYNGSSAILKGIKDQIHAVELKYKNDSLNYFRQKKLWDQNIGSKVTYDTKKLNYELSQNSLRLLHNTYNRTQNELRTALIQAQNNYQSTLINTRDFTVKSKINGKVYALFKEPGEIVNTMEPIAVIGSETNFIIELLIDEVDIVRLQKGQELVIKLDAYANQVFKGHISKIYPKKDERNQTFKVEATFIQAPDVLYPGLSGEGNIIIATKEKVLTIPVAYLMDGNQVKTDNGFITVTTGLQNMEYVEIQSGLSKGTYIYKPE
ncbi:Multidrug efflux pump subunit AcrA (membrane-fusion protein) [Formosa sp. Hel1_31_208]|nr:Multidrug efflux pump subunit AcrA (membrane-fusion protein) [Formosa sp. Hel1_31_208]